MRRARQPRGGDPRLTPPARAIAARAVLERHRALNGVADAFEAKREVVSVGSELKLEVPLAWSDDEELDDLVIPQRRARTRWTLGRWVAVPRRVDEDLKPVAAKPHVERDDLARRALHTLPCSVDFEPHAP